jgi:drug/metabolite transporter (DMT)-like permease
VRLSGRWRVWVPLVTLWIVWGSTYLGTSAAVQSMPPLLSAGSRYLLAAVPLFVGLAIATGPRSLRLTASQVRSTIVLGLGIIGVWAAASSLSQRYLPSGIAALIGSTIPVWIVLLRLSSGDRPSRRTGAGVAIGLTGVALMLLPGGIVPVGDVSPGAVAFWGSVMVVGSISWAYFSWRSPGFDVPASSLVTAAYQLMWAGCVVMGAGFAVGERVDVSTYTTASWLGWSWLILASVIGYSAFTFLVANAPISLVSTFPYVNPLVAVFLGWLILGEPVSRSVAIGLVVVIGGVVLVVTGERRPRRQRRVVR